MWPIGSLLRVNSTCNLYNVPIIHRENVDGMFGQGDVFVCLGYTSDGDVKMTNVMTRDGTFGWIAANRLILCV